MHKHFNRISRETGGVMKIVLANSDYKNHMTSEGNELQEGLKANDWKLCGFGYDGITHVGKILRDYEPQYIFVQDCRDWREDSGGCFDNRVSYTNWDLLHDYPGKKITVLKDAGSVKDYQLDFFDDINADMIVHYYHDRALKDLGWDLECKTARIYHSIDKTKIPIVRKTKNAIISGALGAEIYPHRTFMTERATEYGLDTLPHPGYHNHKCYTDDYIQTLAQYKVSVSTCSVWNFSLRKIIEAVACGCVCITNLPEWDILPGIDSCLVRFNNKMKWSEIKDLIRHEVEHYDSEKAWCYQKIAMNIYDYRVQGMLLNEAIIRKLRN